MSIKPRSSSLRAAMAIFSLSTGTSFGGSINVPKIHMNGESFLLLSSGSGRGALLTLTFLL